MANKANVPNMEAKGRNARIRETPRHHIPKPCYETAREDYGWEGTENSGE